MQQSPRRFDPYIEESLGALRRDGLYKAERIITSPQSAHIQAEGRPVINLCANNYLGLACDPRLVAAAEDGLRRFGLGMASVRFICGTTSLHKDLEAAVADFLDAEDSILYSSCFDANGGLFETLMGAEDAIISDALNHASIIDGIRLSKARRLVYANRDMNQLEDRLRESQDARFRMIATDGVFSMDGTMADLRTITDLAARYDALVMVDDSHAVGFVGPGGRGTPAAQGVAERVDLWTGTFGKALGGAGGGYIAGRRGIIEYLRQRSRPYLFSNTLPPPIAAAALEALKIARREPERQAHLTSMTQRFRKGLESAGLSILPGSHPIIPVMIGDAAKAVDCSRRLLDEGIYVIGFSFPVVPKGAARIRTQMSASLSVEDVDAAIRAFQKVCSGAYRA